MIIQKLRQHWPARKMEWVSAAMSLHWGAYVYSTPEMFTNPATRQIMRGMAEMAPYGWTPAHFWGTLAMLVGASGLLALYVNGAHVRTPVVRVVSAFLRMFIFTQVTIALYASGIPNMGLVVYPWLVVADILSAYTAANDAIHAEVQRRTERGQSARNTSPRTA